VGRAIRRTARAGSDALRGFLIVRVGSSAFVAVTSSALTCTQVNTAVTETLSIRLDSTTKRRLSALANTSKRSASFLAAEAIASFVEQEEW